jgi:hypothetical protein
LASVSSQCMGEDRLGSIDVLASMRTSIPLKYPTAAVQPSVLRTIFSCVSVMGMCAGKRK